jgi:hypothetical protein
MMQLPNLAPTEFPKAIGIGVATALLLSAVMVPALRLGISPLPKPLGLAFAETLLDRPLPLPVGLLFHLAYVTAWSVAYVALFRPALTFGRALLLGLVLWLLVLFVFFPIVGWGVLGLAVTPKLIVASLVPHLLFAVFLWGLCRLGFRHVPAAATGHG